MNKKLSEILNGWRTERDDVEAPSLVALDVAEALFANMKHTPRCAYAFDNGIHVELTSLCVVEISESGSASIVCWNDARDGVLTILPLKTSVEVPA